MKPILHLIVGLPGSGKTALARRLERDHSALRLTPDEWIARLLPAGWDGKELDRLRDPTEAIEWEMASRARAEAVGARVRIHFCDVSLEDLRARLAARNESLGPGEFGIDEAALTLWASRFEPPTPDELQS